MFIRPSAGLWFLCTLWIAATAPLQAQPPTTPDTPPHIEVVGTSEAEVTPDQIFLAITLRERMENKEKISVESQEEQLKKRLQAAGIDLAGLTLADATGDFASLRRKRRETVSERRYQLQVSTAEQVTKVAEVADAINIEDVRIDRVHHSKMEELRRQTRIKAVQAAQDKAQYMLQVLGSRTGKPLYVVEQTYNQIYPVQTNTMYENSYYGARTAAEDDSAGNVSISFKSIKVRVSVFVRFEIVQ